MAFPVTTVASLACLVLQIWLLRHLAPHRPVGDEAEYLAGHPTGAGDAVLWVRVPVFGWLIRAAQRISPDQPDAPRMVSVLISVLAIALATATVEHSFGARAALIPATLMLVSVERAVLALHLWPDMAMGVVLLGFALLMTTTGPLDLVALSLCAALGFGLRIEGAALIFVTVALATAQGALAALAVALGFLCLTCGFAWYNGRRFGVWWPDTTAAFNMAVARAERRNPDASVHELMHGATRPVSGEAGTSSSASALHPGVIMRRQCGLLGAESFVTENLLQANYAGYGTTALPGILPHLLRHGFTASLLLMLPVAGLAPWPMTALLAAFTLVYSVLQTRSRYRMALLPLIAAITGLGWAELLARPLSQTLGPVGVGLVLAALLILLLLRVTPRRELPASPPDRA